VNLFMCENKCTGCSVCEVDLHEPINLRIVQYKYDMSYTSLRFFFLLSIHTKLCNDMEIALYLAETATLKNKQTLRVNVPYS